VKAFRYNITFYVVPVDDELAKILWKLSALGCYVRLRTDYMSVLAPRRMTQAVWAEAFEDFEYTVGEGSEV
jgi:hypothetical protein